MCWQLACQNLFTHLLALVQVPRHHWSWWRPVRWWWEHSHLPCGGETVKCTQGKLLSIRTSTCTLFNNIIMRVYLYFALPPSFPTGTFISPSPSWTDTFGKRWVGILMLRITWAVNARGSKMVLRLSERQCSRLARGQTVELDFLIRKCIHSRSIWNEHSRFRIVESKFYGSKQLWKTQNSTHVSACLYTALTYL